MSKKLPMDEEFATPGNFSYATEYAHDAGQGLSEETVHYISKVKGEPKWLLNFRLRALRIFNAMPIPSWIPVDLSPLQFDKIRYYLAKGQEPKRKWEDVPAEVKATFDRLGVPEHERKFLAGVEAQFDSEMAYANLRQSLAEKGVIFVDSTEGLLRYESVFRPHFGKIVAAADNKFSALNGAVFSGGSFIYIPKGAKLDQPLQAYFRINAERFGQFERTLIVVDEGADVTYLEGCTAPRFESATLHAAVVELIAMPGAKIQYITVQNWSSNVYNLVTKRGMAHELAGIRWIDCNIGSRITMKYPCVILAGSHASGEMVSISVAHHGQYQDTGAKMIHRANHTTSHIVAKSISIQDGVAAYRGMIKVAKAAKNCKNYTRCDAMLLNRGSISKTSPTLDVSGNLSQVQHEATVSRVSDEQVFYLQQRGLGETQAMGLLVNGFLNELMREFPMEYGVELKRLIEMEMERR
ncbi:MAG: Fe-S cluster assembly protein SufB [Puniceicoccales bacterium]|jgi:Fe-S cluster assembly protein SufB|nr:Fe-S cluster assembly protein SufB [Puniceicoccales bacterium]